MADNVKALYLLRVRVVNGFSMFCPRLLNGVAINVRNAV